MSKIVTSVLCVLLSFVMLFTFVRASFGAEPLLTSTFVNGVSELSYDFSRTKEHLASLREAFDKIEFHTWEDVDFTVETQKELRMENGNIFVLQWDEYKVEDDGTLIAPNGARYTKNEYTLRNFVAFVDIGFFNRYTLWDYMVAELESVFASSEEETFISNILKSFLYLNSFVDYLASCLTMFLHLTVVVIALVKDTVFFLVDVMLLLLQFLGIDSTSKLPLTT